MNTNKLTVFICKKTRFQEYDEIIHAVSSRGMIQFIAKGILKEKSKQRINCELGSYVEVELTTGKLPRLKSSTLIDSALIDDYEQLLITQLICDLCFKTNFQNYDCLHLMRQLTQYHKLFYFLYHLTLEQGIALQVNYCVRTSKQDEIVAISIRDGGYITKSALQSDDIRLTKNQLLNFNLIERVNEQTISKYQQQTISYVECAVYLSLIKAQLNTYSTIQSYLQEGNKYEW